MAMNPRLLRPLAAYGVFSMNLKIKRVTPTDDVEVALDTTGADIIEVDLSNAAINTYLSLAGLAGGVNGRMIFLHNVGTGTAKDIVFFYGNTNASAANRIVQPKDFVSPGSTHGQLLGLEQGRCVPLHYSDACGGWVLHYAVLGGIGGNSTWSQSNATSPSYGGGGL